MSYCLKLRSKKTIDNSSATVGSDNSLTPLTPKNMIDYVLLLETTLQKNYCLNSSATVGSDNSLTPLTPKK